MNSILELIVAGSMIAHDGVQRTAQIQLTRKELHNTIDILNRVYVPQAVGVGDDLDRLGQIAELVRSAS